MVGKDAVPEFHAEQYPPGTAPADKSHEPNPINEIPGQADNPNMQSGTSAADTLGGSTSADVHK